MFTGIVQTLGEVLKIEQGKEFWTVVFRNELAKEFKLGDSVMTQGVCLTVSEIFDEQTYAVQIVPETLAKTNLRNLKEGMMVNLEPSLRLSDALHGHLVLGHTDTTVQVLRIVQDSGFEVFLSLPDRDLNYAIMQKGSVCLDGVSLTVASRSDADFSVALIPETLNRTTFGRIEVGQIINLEIDVIVRYLSGILANRV